MLRRLTWFVLLLCLLAGAACAESIRGYDKQDGYQYVLAGSYPYEKDGTEAPVLWRVLAVENDEALLLTEYLIDTKQITFSEDPVVLEKHTYENLSDFRDTDLWHWLNSDMLEAMFGQDPLLGAIVETEQGRVTILNTAQLTNTAYGFAKNLYTNTKIVSRLGFPTPYAIATGTYYDRHIGGSAGWWISDFPKTKKCGIVGVNGHISNNFYTRKKVGVRPALTMDLSRVTVVSGTGTKEDPFVLQYAAPAAYAPFIRLAEAGASDVAFRFAAEAETDAPAEAPENTEGATEADDSTVKEDLNGSDTLLLSFVGDISIDATQSRKNPISLTNIIKENGYKFPFSLLYDYLSADDCTFANLEVVLTEREKQKSSKMYNMIAPPDYVNILPENSIEVVNTVNNHCFDFGKSGYQDTLDALDGIGLTHFGTIYPGMPQESDILGVKEVKGIKIGMVGMSYPTQNTDPNKNRDLKRYKERIQRLKDEMGCQLIVCSVHWGHEGYMTRIDGWQYRFAKELIDAGADVVWGHHPHVLQPTYFYKGKPIMFSTGNFLFGLIGNDINPATGIFQLRYSLEGGTPTLKEFSLVPCENGKRGDYRPFELEGAKRNTCWKYLIAKRAIQNCEVLPASFGNTGRVLIGADGALLDAEE